MRGNEGGKGGNRGRRGDAGEGENRGRWRGRRWGFDRTRRGVRGREERAGMTEMGGGGGLEEMGWWSVEGKRGGSWARGGDERRGCQCCDPAATAAAGRRHDDV